MYTHNCATSGSSRESGVSESLSFSHFWKGSHIQKFFFFFHIQSLTVVQRYQRLCLQKLNLELNNSDWRPWLKGLCPPLFSVLYRKHSRATLSLPSTHAMFVEHRSPGDNSSPCSTRAPPIDLAFPFMTLLP